MQEFRADPAVLDIDRWQFSAARLEPGRYVITIDGLIGLTDPTQPASEARFLGIDILILPGAS